MAAIATSRRIAARRLSAAPDAVSSWDIGSRGSGELGPDVDLGAQGPVHRALVGDRDQCLALIIAERADQLDAALDAIEEAVLGLAVGAVGGVNAVVAQ